ncbi:MAG: DNA polymerase I [bacterium]|nr:DNA polymerase I [bacterium]
MAKAKRERLYLIDGYSNIFRAFYAIRNLSNSKGFPTNAIYGFQNMLRKLLREEEPELIGVAWDVSEPTVRTEKFEDYKANRSPTPEDLKPQLPYIRRLLEALHIPILELEAYEADDVIGTLAKKAAAAGFDVTLVSADKDLLQLVDDHVSMYHTGREKTYDPAMVEEDLGVPPNRVIDIMALKGDSVDNIPGVPGIGEKGAVQLIREFGDLATLLDRAEEVTRKSYRTGLTEHRDKAELSKELVTIHTDLPVDFDAEALRLSEPDRGSLRELYRELEFFSLLEELGKETSSAAPVGAAVEVETCEAWRDVAGGLGNEIFIAAIKPSRASEDGSLGLAVSGEEGDVFYVDFRRQDVASEALASLGEWLRSSDRSLQGHDLKEVLRLIAEKAEDVRFEATLFDTMLASYLLPSAARTHGLEEVALERLGVQAVTESDAGWGRAQEPPLGSEGLLAFAAERIELPRRMATAMRKELEQNRLEGVYERIGAPLISVLVRMEEHGILLDTGFLRAMSSEMAKELTSLESQIYEIAGDKFNINSPRQLGEIMFERLGYPVIKKTRKTKSYSTDSGTLEELAIRGYELPEKILKFRELAKLKSTYVDAFPSLVAADGRLHTRFHQAVAATGRLSSASPNLQNIPIRTEQGQQIRKAFVAPEGRILLVADYNQIELRVLAHIAEEPALIEAFRAGEDMHAATAGGVFEVAPALVTPDQRRAAKVINFGIMYGMSAFGLAQNLRIPKAEAERFIKAYLDRYGAVREYMDSTIESAKKDGRVETLYGRIRWLPDIESRNYNMRENAKRMAINARIQGTAADLLKIAMIQVDRRLAEERPDSKLLLTVHDELVLEVPEQDIAAVSDLVVQEMEQVDRLDVPLVVDVGHGKSWYEAKT